MRMSGGMQVIVAFGAVLAVTSALVSQTKEQSAQVRVGTIGLTKASVSENHVRQRMGSEVAQNVKVAEMSDAALYRALMAGEIDLGSLLALPQDVGVKEFDRAFKTPPRVLTLGHLAVSVCASSKRSLSQLSVKEVSQLISGEITDWGQLGAGEGKIQLMSDEHAIDLIVALSGVKPVKTIKKVNEGMKAIAVAGNDSLILSSSKIHEMDLARMSPVVLVPVTVGDKDRAVLPSMASIQDGSYPLARPWRLILRPNAQEAAEKVASMLADVEKGGDFDPWLQFWLVHPAASAISNHIRIATMGWGYELMSAAKAYQQIHPEVTIAFSNDYLNVPNRLLRGEVDLATYTGEFLDHIGGPDYETFGKGFPQPSIERTIGYWPFAVAVHPANPMKSITTDQLRLLLSDPGARWGDIGRSTDGRIRLYLYQASTVARALGNGQGSDAIGKPLSLRGADKHRERIGLLEDSLPDLADDPEGIAIWYHNKKLAASGYKILPIIAGPRKRALALTDTAAVASGQYPLRTPLKVLIRASAPKHVRDFVDWLWTAQAAKPFKSPENDRDSHWPVAHVSEAAAIPSSMAAKTQQADPVRANDGLDGPIDGAVAILPIEPLSTVFRMANRSHHAGYETAVSDAIQADGRLKIVDRTQLARALAERRLQILGLEVAPVKPIVSADILVISHVVTEDLKTFLRVRAIQGSTGGLLSELKLQINAADPAAFDPPLTQAVARWWPGVLQRLRDSRDKPSWVLLDVYPSDLSLLETAEALRKELQASLTTNRSIFAPGDSALDEAQQETLLRILGLAHASGGRFTPAADYLVDARLLEGGKLQVRLRDAALKVLAEETFSGDANALQSTANGWLKRQIGVDPRRPAPATMSAGDIDDWARQQAVVELEMSRQLHSRIRALYTQKGGQRDAPEVLALRTAARAHARRAAQLDPANEDAAYEALPAYLDLARGWVSGGDNVPSTTMVLAPMERFLDSFPRSSRYADILSRHAYTCGFFATKAPIPKGEDERATRLACHRKALADYTHYLMLFGRPDAHGTDLKFDGYLYRLQEYLSFAQPQAQECETLVAEWSKQFDAQENKACHSDFLRLVVLKYKADRAGFIELLTKMQKRWPDPKHPQWGQTISPVDGMIFGLFKGVESSNSSFQLWHRGLRGIGDIPKLGYKLEDDKLKFGSVMLMFAFPGDAMQIKDGIRKAGVAYRVEQPGVEVLTQTAKVTVVDAAESGHCLMVVLGQLPPDDLKALKEIYRGKDLPLRRIGYYRALSGSSSQEVSILCPPGPGKSEVLDDFIRFLNTADGQKILLENGIYSSAQAATPTRPAERVRIGADVPIPVKQSASGASNRL